MPDASDVVRGLDTDFDGARDASVFSSWRQRIAPLYDLSLPEGEAETRFRLKGTTWQLPCGYVNEAAGSPIVMRRSSDWAAKSPVDSVSFYCCREGRITADYDGRSVSMQAGDLIFIDFNRPYESEATAFACCSVILPRGALPMEVSEHDLHGIVLRASTGAGKLLRQQLELLVAALPTLRMSEAVAAFGAFVGLASNLWPRQTPIESDQSLVVRALAIIAEKIQDLDLSPATLARELGVSRTQLYSLFEQRGGIVACIQEMRLDESFKRLVVAPSRPGVVKELALRLGFRDHSHFSRAFQARFGMRPSEVAGLSARAAGGGTYADWLDRWAREPGYEMIDGWLRTAVFAQSMQKRVEEDTGLAEDASDEFSATNVALGGK